MATQGLHFHTQAFSSFGFTGLSLWWLLLLWSMGSRACRLQYLWNEAVVLTKHFPLIEVTIFILALTVSSVPTTWS